MGFIECVQGQREGSRGPLILIPISEGIPQDVLQSFGVQESQEDLQGLHLAGLGAINTSLLRGDEGVSPSSSGRSGLVLQGEELVCTPGAEFGLWICNPPEDWLV